MENLGNIAKASSTVSLEGLPEGYDGLLLANLAIEAAANNKPLLHITTDANRMETLAACLQFFGSKQIDVLQFPAWDCLPYDRVSPTNGVLAERLTTLFHLHNNKSHKKPLIILTTINAAGQKTPPQSLFDNACLNLSVGDNINEEKLITFLVSNGYSRSDQVMEAGEFAVRGGLIDIYPPSGSNPIRLDFFGDEIDQMRHFDPLSQRSLDKIKHTRLLPVNEFLLSPENIQKFRTQYRALFGSVMGDDPLYAAVSEGRSHYGMEHWLPLFHENLSNIFSYVPDAVITIDYHAEQVRIEREQTIRDYYQARLDAPKSSTSTSSAYNPLPPEMLYISDKNWKAIASETPMHTINPFCQGGENSPNSNITVFSGKLGRDFAPERQAREGNIYDVLREHIKALKKTGKDVIFASYSNGSRERMMGLLKDHDITPCENIEHWSADGDKKTVKQAILSLEHGFESDNLAIITETDLLGDRLVRKGKRGRKAENFITEAASMQVNDLVVHINHGIGKFEGLKTINVTGAPHDCLMLTYMGGDRLYLPVENIEMLSRFGGQDSETSLDKLGGAGWQVRHAKLKERLNEMADQLIKIAADRALSSAPVITTPEHMYEEFCARFPFPETEDQQSSINDVLADLKKGQAMDRLVCGDVGFGKTEVALRAAFISAMAGLQVVVVVPTTLLCRQHTKTFLDRFKGLPIVVKQLSRLVNNAAAKEVKEGLEKGVVDIVIGTHAVLAKDLKFKNLGLVVIDEEQHFGVAHKERLKSLKTGVHVLTLTATPIPRTLQLAMSGVRELSLMTTPPIDRLAVRTFITPFDEAVIREALLREHYRGGQSFFVCPRISDLEEIQSFLKQSVPELKVVTAHGRMTPTRIDDTMNAFYDGKYDILLATTIIESGLDIPSVNTIIIHRAEMFGLAQLYQLRGRVGRSKVRAYAYLTVPANKILTDTATKRLQVMHSLDTLGAGFTLASHDMDIRGTGNLLGQEQSGHIREVGLELYQQMLEEAVANAKNGAKADDGEVRETNNWSPQINVGASVLIPESYVKDLNLRMGLYRRLGDIKTPDDIEGFAAELIDRFGSLPPEVKQLLEIIKIKNLCLKAGIEKIEAGKKGAIVSFHQNRFSNPLGLVEYINKRSRRVKLRPDHKLVYIAKWETPQERLGVCAALAGALARLASAS
jgi:transcription-repair coupling factor (superfamily II helicase)